MDYLSSLPGALALGLIWGIMAIGVYITYKILNFADLTVDGSFATGGAVAAVVIVSGGSFWLGLLLGFLAGVAAGLITALLHTVFGIPGILAGILTQLMLWSINLKIMGSKSNISVSARSYGVLLSQLDIAGALWKLALIVAIIIGLLYLFFGTEIGSAIRATGDNSRMAKAQGINVKWTTLLGLVLSNGLVALAGAILTQYQGFADINMGRGAIVIGLASVIIGEAIFSHFGRNFALRLTGVAVGAVIYYFVYQTVVFLGMDTDLLKMLSAVVVAIFLAVPYLRRQAGPWIARRRNVKQTIIDEGGGNQC